MIRDVPEAGRAAELDLVIYRDGRFSHEFEFVSVDEGDEESPLNLTAMGPFVCQVRHASRDIIICDLDVTELDLLNGRINVSIEASETSLLIPGRYYWSLASAQGYVLMQGRVEVAKTFI